MRHGIVCAFATALVCACQPGEGATAPSTQRAITAVSNSAKPDPKSVSPISMQELSRIVGATCEDVQAGEKCSGGDYDIMLRPSCDRDGLFAQVSDPKGSLLIDKAPPDDSVRRAMLARGQVVCIQAIALAGESPSYYYVVALPEANKELPVNPKIAWIVPHKGDPCRMVSKGRFIGDCAAGWTDEAGLEVLASK